MNKDVFSERLGFAKIIGIDGLGGSGKTTYAENLQREIEGSIVFHLDDFIHPENVRYNDNFQQWYCYYEIQWRYDYFIQKILKPVKTGNVVNEQIEFYNKTDDSYSLKDIYIPLGTTIIVEGVFLQRPELRAFFDYVIFLNVNEEERLTRVLKRDLYIGNETQIRQKYEERYFPAEQHYMDQCDCLALANEVIN